MLLIPVIGVSVLMKIAALTATAHRLATVMSLQDAPSRHRRGKRRQPLKFLVPRNVRLLVTPAALAITKRASAPADARAVSIVWSRRLRA
jgi:hypothetical protein